MESKRLGYTLSEPNANLRTKLLCCACDRLRLHNSTGRENGLR